MARRKELLGIADGIASSFISRNNDVKGLWAPGKLYGKYYQAEPFTIYLNIYNHKTTPSDEDLLKNLEYNYSKILASHLENRHLKFEYIKTALIIVRFKQHYPFPEPPLITWGDPFICTVQITDDHNHKYERSYLSRCGFPKIFFHL